MDFLHPDKKRKRLIKLILGYFLMAVALGIATLIVVFINLGYDIDRNTGVIIQKGLLIVGAHPESADIFINGANRGQTSERYELPEGTYSVELRRGGYEPWKHDLNLEGGSIEQLVYPFLFPTTLQTKSIASFTSAPMASQSPDRRWLVVERPDKAGEFRAFDLNDPDNPADTITLPSDTLTPSTSHRFEAIEWSSDNRNLLIKHTFKGGSEFIMLNRSNAVDSFNVTKLFPGQPVTAMALRDKKANRFYFYNKATSTVVAANSSDLSLTALLKNVVQFKSYKNDHIIYIGGTNAPKGMIELHLWKDGKDYVLKNLPADDRYLIDAAEFENGFYLVAGSPADGRIFLYKNPLAELESSPSKTPLPFRALNVKGARYVSFSTISRFIAVQGGGNFAVYDAENGRQYKYSTGLDIEAGQRATWMDGHRLVAVSGGRAVVFDFDNENKRILDKATSSLPVVFNRDYDAMFSLVSQGDKGEFSLRRTELRVPPVTQR